MDIKVKYFNKDITKLEKIAKGDWIDLRCAEPNGVTIKAGGDAIIKLGVGMIFPDGYEAYKDGVKYKSTDGKNWVPETEHQNCKTRYVFAEHDYTKIQNYIEAIRLIAEKLGTAESDCIEQLARDVGNYLYDLVQVQANK